jgi:deoxyribodipyrimidine photo-lyase
MIDARRARMLNKAEFKKGPICYWMSRDQRVHDNWALLFAQEKAKQYNVPFIVCFNFVDSFLNAPLRHYHFMLEGLQEVVAQLQKYQIPFYFVEGQPQETLPALAQQLQLGAVVTDFSPLKVGRNWRSQVAQALTIPLVEVDAHNLVPCWVASPKQEFAAYTFRPKIHKLLPEFLTDFPPLQKQDTVELPVAPTREIVVPKILERLAVDLDVKPVTWVKAGETAARQTLENFIHHRLSSYDHDRNDPTLEAQSELSPYLHYGQLSAQRIAWELQHHHGPSSAAFLEELIVRRELSDNFCFYNQNYDSVKGFPKWAQQTLAKHASDPRPTHYGRADLEAGTTSDPAWNAAQHELVQRGKLHGYMRMYWAKQLLNWTKDVQQALHWAIYLNDKYSLDGRDPNGYVGIAWSLGGVHDRVWFERPIFGQVRYMNFNGLKHKFKIEKYIQKWNGQNLRT